MIRLHESIYEARIFSFTHLHIVALLIKSLNL